MLFGPINSVPRQNNNARHIINLPFFWGLLGPVYPVDSKVILRPVVTEINVVRLEIVL